MAFQWRGGQVATRFGVWFGLLGPLQVRRDGADIRVSAPRHRVLLAHSLILLEGCLTLILPWHHHARRPR